MQVKQYLGTLLFVVLVAAFAFVEGASPFLPDPIILRNRHMIQLVLELESNNSYIHYVQDPTENKYLFKQKKYIYFDKMLLYSVRDIFASIIAHRLDIPSNYVWFVPPYIDFPGKKIANAPATLHTVVPGTVVANIRELSPKIRIKQWSIKKNPHGAGLTVLVVKSMAEHPDLPRLVAFDTIISNADRHNRNIFYDEKENKFYGIDMDSTFRLESEIVSASCANVFAMINDPTIVFSRREFRALKSYKKTLELFLQKFPVSALHTLVDECFRKTGYIVRGSRDTNVALMHAVINVNYNEIKRLIQLLERLLATKKNRAERELL